MRKSRTANERIPARLPAGSSSVALAFLFFAVIASSTMFHGDMALVLAAYVIVNMLAYVAYALDKSAARQGRWRISESSLHLLALAGGWPGAVLAQQVLRHKTKKQSFRLAFWITVVLNCCAFVWLFTPSGLFTLRIVAATITDSLLK